MIEIARSSRENTGMLLDPADVSGYSNIFLFFSGYWSGVVEISHAGSTSFVLLESLTDFQIAQGVINIPVTKPWLKIEVVEFSGINIQLIVKGLSNQLLNRQEFVLELGDYNSITVDPSSHRLSFVRNVFVLNSLGELVDVSIKIVNLSVIIESNLSLDGCTLIIT